MFNFEGFTVPKFSLENLQFPTIPCRAIIYDVIVNESDTEEGLGEIDIAFLLFSPSFNEPMVFEKHFSNWSIYGGIEAAFQCLITDDDVCGFTSLIGSVFEAEIYFGVDKEGIYNGFQLTQVVSLPTATNNY